MLNFEIREDGTIAGDDLLKVLAINASPENASRVYAAMRAALRAARMPRDDQRAARIVRLRGDWNWSDEYLPLIRAIVGPHLLRVAPLAMDRAEACDLMTLKTRPMMIAARVRRPQYRERYANEFVIRASAGGDGKTELQKMVDGYADWMFYGFADDSAEIAFAHWVIVDLNVWRATLIRMRPRCLFTARTNPADGGRFVAFDIRRFPPDLIVASGGYAS